MKKLLVLALFLALSLCTQAQEQHDWQRLFAELSTQEDLESASWQDTYEVLSDLEEHPIDINTASREDLERIPFLTAQQIEDLLAYVYQYHGMRSLAELRLVKSLDATRCKLLCCFVYAGAMGQKGFPTLASIARNGKSTLLATAKVPFYERQGDREGYLGYRYRHSVRYDFSMGNYVRLGLTGAQDAGEPFFAGKNKAGYDFYSFYLVLRRLGPLKALAVGRYKLKFGLGLVMNNDVGIGKLTMLGQLSQSANTIRPYTSRMEAGYMQGAAATVSLSKAIDVSAFVSYRKIDATLNRDTGTIATILTTGLHRTESEMARRHNASETVAGGNVHATWHGLHVGLTGLAVSLSRPLDPGMTQRYRRYYPRGDHFYNVSIDYGYTSSRFSLSGETATGDSHAVATLNMLAWQPTEALHLVAVQRFYSYKYYALMGRSFSAGGHLSNESGLYVGVTWLPAYRWQVQACSDYAYFAWPKFGVDEASHASDNMLTVTYGGRKMGVAARYRLVLKQKNNKQHTALADDVTHRGRLQLSWKEETWNVRVQGDVAYNDFKQRSWGWMASATASWQPLKGLSMTGMGGYFSTDDYASRIYVYERGPLYAFSFPAFYGRGIRYALLLRADVSAHVMLTAKVGTTDYFDRDHISSGLQRIDRSSMTDMELQLRLKF